MDYELDNYINYITINSKDNYFILIILQLIFKKKLFRLKINNPKLTLFFIFQITLF